MPPFFYFKRFDCDLKLSKGHGHAEIFDAFAHSGSRGLWAQRQLRGPTPAQAFDGEGSELGAEG
jgi:hypothetical protein